MIEGESKRSNEHFYGRTTHNCVVVFKKENYNKKIFLNGIINRDHANIKEILKFLKNGSLYNGYKPVLWSVVEATALADAEVEYADHKSSTIYAKFPIQENFKNLENSFSNNFTHGTSNGIQINTLALQGASNNRILCRVTYASNNGSVNTMHHTDGWNDSYAYASAEL